MKPETRLLAQLPQKASFSNNRLELSWKNAESKMISLEHRAHAASFLKLLDSRSKARTKQTAS
jgi:hypothetical protein